MDELSPFIQLGKKEEEEKERKLNDALLNLARCHGDDIPHSLCVTKVKREKEKNQVMSLNQEIIIIIKLNEVFYIIAKIYF